MPTDPMTPTDALAALRAVVERMTAGPAKLDLDRFADDENVSVVVELGVTGIPGKRAFEDMFVSEIEVNQGEPWPTPWADARQTQEYHNGAGLVTLRNLAPEMLAVVQAAEREHEHCPGYVYVAVRTTHGDRIQQPCGTCAALTAFTAAVAREVNRG